MIRRHFFAIGATMVLWACSANPGGEVRPEEADVMSQSSIVALAEAAQGGEHGNGGDAVVCLDPQGNIKSARLYDYFEAEAKWGLLPAIEDLGTTEWDIVQGFLSNLEKVQPYRARQYQEIYQKFKVSHRIAANARLVDVPDSDPSILPFGCLIEQAAIQRPPEFPRDSYFTIAGPIWDNMKPLDRAGLILHEVIYFDLIADGAVNSKNARYIHANIVSQEAVSFTQKQYLDLYRIGSRVVEFDRRQFVNNDKLRVASTYVEQGQLLSSMREEFLIEQFRDPSSTTIQLIKCPSQVGQDVLLHKFSEDGSLRQGCVDDAIVYLSKYNGRFIARKVFEGDDSTKFDVSGLRSHLSSYSPVSIPLGGMNFFILGLKDVVLPGLYLVEAESVTIGGSGFLREYIGSGYFSGTSGSNVFFSSLRVSDGVLLEGAKFRNNNRPADNFAFYRLYSEIPSFIDLSGTCDIRLTSNYEVNFYNDACRKTLKFPNGESFNFELADEVEIPTSPPTKMLHLRDTRKRYSEFGWYADGKHTLVDLGGETRCILQSPEDFTLKFYGKEEVVKATQISFDEQGKVFRFRAVPGWSSILEMSIGGTNEFFGDYDIWLDPEGKVKQFRYRVETGEISSSNIRQKCF